MKLPNSLLQLILVCACACAMAPGVSLAGEEPALPLARASVPVDIPLHKGFYTGQPVHYIITDSNDEQHARLITQRQRWRVELAPLLSHTPNEARGAVYLFTNGVKGDGIHGFQSEVFPDTPAQPEQYSALRSVVHVSWKKGNKAEILDSAAKILEAKDKGRVQFEVTTVVLNMPQIAWPGGHMLLREQKTLSDDAPYGGGQLLALDTGNMKATFVAHRGWGPNGRTIYYIVTDAAPVEPAQMMGVVSAPTVAKTINSAAAVDLFQFANGLKGTGPMGFQPGIAVAATGDPGYSPLWRISMVEWKNPANARLLETLDDIRVEEKRGEVTVSLARPMDSDHVVNCPFIDPFQ